MIKEESGSLQCEHEEMIDAHIKGLSLILIWKRKNHRTFDVYLKTDRNRE